ncbi:MAG: DUF3048 domain-containing protein [Anaerolineaceae bacterium]|nr:DUF3048 domain-containing protein [Anaerolineaceae bacterium]
MGLIKSGLLFAFLGIILSGCQSQIFSSPVINHAASTPTIAASNPAANDPLPSQTSTPIPYIAASETPSGYIIPTLQPTSVISTSEAATSLLGPYVFPTNVNPLTGLVVNDPSILNRRPVMIKVANFPRYGRPHAGLSYADLVFEYYIGEETNRFLAVYYSQDAPKIGPVRSGRLIDPQLVNMFGGLLVYGNADPQVDGIILKMLGDRALSFNNLPCPVMCGTATHSVAGVFANSGAVTQYATKTDVSNDRQDLQGLVFNSKPPATSQTATMIGVQYSYLDRGEWHYDPTSGKYLRWIESGDGTKNGIPMEPLVDRLNGQQLAFSNVIIAFATYIEYAPTLHDIEIWKNTHGQRAVLFRDGEMIEGTWRTEQYDHPMHFYDQMGIPMALKPGTTWVVIAGTHSTLEQPSPGHWEMQFHMP